MAVSLHNTSRAALALVLPALLPIVGCTDSGAVGPNDAPNGLSAAFGIWAPGSNDTCTPEIHDKYAVVGPDGKLYPTWHPPVDPETGCTFGHEHGRDPRGSDLYRQVGDIPFGYANEVLDTYDPSGPRHEDHFGHKMEWENNVDMNFGDAGSTLFKVKCDVLIKMHQGSHSKDAFTNNLHELAFHADCDDGTRLHVTFLTIIGDAGGFTANCTDQRVEVGAPVPGNSPDGGGQRKIPDVNCAESNILVAEGQSSDFGDALRESWQLSHSLRARDGSSLASINSYFNVFNPSRFFDPAMPNVTGRPIDLCYLVTQDGRRARGGACEEATAGGTITDVTWDDPRSPFTGASRDVDINSIRVSNPDGPETWYTDPFGKNGRTERFAGSIKQFIAQIDNDGVTPSGPGIGRNRNYGVQGVHAPN